MKIDSIGMSGSGVKATNTKSTSFEKTASTPKEQATVPIQEVILSEIPNSEALTEDEPKEGLNKDMMDKAIKQANKALEVYDKSIERSIHEVTHTVMYVVRDTKTNEIIKEFPPKKIQDMIAKMWELAGLFVDEKA